MKRRKTSRKKFLFGLIRASIGSMEDVASEPGSSESHTTFALMPLGKRGEAYRRHE
jgi:hypothetical protein